MPSLIEEHQDVLPDCRDELSESGSLSVSAWMKTSASSEMRPRACPRDHGCDQKGGGSSLSIVLPALNEEAGIEAVMNRIPRTILRGRGLSGSINLLDGPSTDWNTHDQEKRSQSTEALPPRRSSRSMPWYGARSDCSASTWNVLASSNGLPWLASTRAKKPAPSSVPADAGRSGIPAPAKATSAAFR